jgi:hypothetical protein
LSICLVVWDLIALHMWYDMSSKLVILSHYVILKHNMCYFPWKTLFFIANQCWLFVQNLLFFCPGPFLWPSSSITIAAGLIFYVSVCCQCPCILHNSRKKHPTSIKSESMMWRKWRDNESGPLCKKTSNGSL